MDTKLDDVVSSLIADVQARLNTQIERTIVDHVRKTLDTFDFEGKINLLTSLKIDNKIGDFELRPELVEAKLQEAADAMIAELNKHARSQITSDIAGKINSIDFDQSMTNAHHNGNRTSVITANTIILCSFCEQFNHVHHRLC